MVFCFSPSVTISNHYGMLYGILLALSSFLFFFFLRNCSVFFSDTFHICNMYIYDISIILLRVVFSGLHMVRITCIKIYVKY